jgi:hypothetical protein
MTHILVLLLIYELQLFQYLVLILWFYYTNQTYPRSLIGTVQL